MSAIHGGRPYATVSTATARPAMATAAHCARRSFSPTTVTASATVTSGLMK